MQLEDEIKAFRERCEIVAKNPKTHIFWMLPWWAHGAINGGVAGTGSAPW